VRPRSPHGTAEADVAVPRPLWTRMTSRAVVLVLVLAALVTTLAMPLREYLQQRSTLGALQQQLESGQARVESLRNQVKQWHDPAYLEAQARARLHYVYPGEIGYVVLTPKDLAAAREPATPATVKPATPWYDTLWSSVQQADQTR
jgi:cell division protein FtsB